MEYLLTIVLATTAGVLARLQMLRRDYRQYPSYPQGWATHVFIGFIGALLGAFLIPSFVEKEFAAVSFLLLAASQFREVRGVERDTLEKMEENEMVPRGSTYIEGIARVFEARNYLAILTALAVGIVIQIFEPNLSMQIIGAVFIGCLTAGMLSRLMKGESIKDIATVEIGELQFDGPLIVVDNVFLMNVGLLSAREIWLEKGFAAKINPKNPNAKATLANIGQMQAIAHDASSMVGVYMDVGEQEFTPIVRRDPESGSLILIMVPAHHDRAAFKSAIENVPVLEGVVRKPLLSKAGKMVD